MIYQGVFLQITRHASSQCIKTQQVGETKIHNLCIPKILISKKNSNLYNKNSNLIIITAVVINDEL